jgi:hypothetical protein
MCVPNGVRAPLKYQKMAFVLPCAREHVELIVGILLRVFRQMIVRFAYFLLTLHPLYLLTVVLVRSDLSVGGYLLCPGLACLIVLF